MKIIVKGEYHNAPAGLHFDGPGVVEVDAAKAEFLFRDAPGNFELYTEPVADAPIEKTFDAPTKDKQIKTAPKKK